MEINKNDYLEQSLALLAQYLEETPLDILEKHFEEIDFMQFEGVTIEQYFKDFDTHFEMFNNSYNFIDLEDIILVGKNSYQISGKLQIHSANGTVSSTEQESFAGNYQYAMAA